nr:MAG: nonstructural protein [Microvirus sp.]
MNSLYTILDRVAEECGPLFESVNDGVALRNFKNLLDKVPPYQKSEYRLYKVGAFDTKTMGMTVLPTPEEVILPEAGNA